MAIYIGIDMGTSGCRACAIDENREILATSAQPMAPALTDGDVIEQDARIWWRAVYPLPAAKVKRVAGSVEPFAFDRIYSPWPGRVVMADGSAVVRRSAKRYLEAMDS